MRRATLGLTAVPAAAAVLFAVATPAGADPDTPAAASPDPTEATAEVTSNVPADLLEYATAVDLAYPEVSLVWDEGASALRVVLDPGADAVEATALAVERGVEAEVVVEEAIYGQAELKRAASDLVASGGATWAAPSPAGSGLEIGVEIATAQQGGDSPSSAPQSEAPAETPAGIPVEVVEEAPVELASRDLDSSPFSAGADISRLGDQPGRINLCSTSFAFTHTLAGGATEERLFTADHCGATGQTWHTGRSLSNPVVGTMTAPAPGVPNADIATIGGQDYAARSYRGPNTSAETLSVSGYSTAIVNSTLCYSGAPSGTVCDNRVQNVGLTIDYGSGFVYENLTRTTQVAGIPAAGSGDSGGPVYALTEDGRASAVGVISGISNGGSRCSGDPSSQSRQCSRTAFFAPVDEYFANNPQASILTSS
ncbi:trypsin-like serine protease [Litorihabitans aurantiacus]|uniref:Peptidase S1 domain-containing protein n=1 Tax=Litorihabitans aurantiacus TaxID=1930061 RepID=A0AA37XHZ3_9MICO|nr:trypsin-like serine protease [Litorihabitans aurantiacus]GMA33307.1 hypothetical protein GCM10025875_32990 [Litorihabitans aurantiacus]